MFAMYPYPFMQYPFNQQQTNKPRRSRRGKNKEQDYMKKRLMEYIDEHETEHDEFQRWLKAKEKKDEKKHDEKKINSAGLAMFFFAMTPFLGLFWLWAAANLIVNSYQSLEPILHPLK